MINAGGIIGIIAGVIGTIAAVVTIFFGGLASGISGGTENTVLWLGFGGILFSFLTIVFSAISLFSKKPKNHGIALILSAIGGIILGGTFVAIFMVLSLISGILVVIGSKKIAIEPPTENVETAQLPQTKDSKAKKIALISGSVVAVLIIIGVIASNKSPQKSAEIKARQTLSEMDQLASAEESRIGPYGELAEIFNLMSKHTNIQRENKEKEIKGQIVVWELPLYEVSKQGDYYRVQTNAGPSAGGMACVGTFVYIKPRNEQEKIYIESIKTGDNITFKGKIDGVSMRNINIKPAILFGESAKTPLPAPPPEALAPSGKAERNLIIGNFLGCSFGQGILECGIKVDGKTLYINNKDSSPSVFEKIDTEKWIGKKVKLTGSLRPEDAEFFIAQSIELVE